MREITFEIAGECFALLLILLQRNIKISRGIHKKKDRIYMTGKQRIISAFLMSGKEEQLIYHRFCIHNIGNDNDFDKIDHIILDVFLRAKLNPRHIIDHTNPQNIFYCRSYYRIISVRRGTL